MSSGTKLKTLNKQENKSTWQQRQPKLQPFEYKISNEFKLNPWKVQPLPGRQGPDNVYGNLTKRERNAIIYQQKTRMAKQLFTQGF